MPVKALSCCVLAFVAGCGVKFSDGSSSGGGARADASADAAVGVACGGDVQTGVVLCAGVSTCPNVLVDPDEHPGCGFLPGSLELECLCPGETVCPMGKPKTCDAARTTIASSNVVYVCSQVSDGNCKPAR